MIIAIGDVHGKFRELKIKIRDILNDYHADDTRIYFVQVGDFGLGFDHPYETYHQLQDLDRDLIEANSQLLVIRGNHDNPSFFNNGNGYHFENILFISDDSIIQVDGKWCYFAGGAISIDRINRIHGVSYWENEIYEFNRDTKLGPIDILFTHDVYHGVSTIKGLGADIVQEYMKKDTLLEQDMLMQQYHLKNLYEFVSNDNLKWYHGHYHESYTIYNENQMVCCLSELEFKEII